jgi:hypothetical protein
MTDITAAGFPRGSNPAPPPMAMVSSTSSSESVTKRVDASGATAAVKTENVQTVEQHVDQVQGGVRMRKQTVNFQRKLIEAGGRAHQKLNISLGNDPRRLSFAKDFIWKLLGTFTSIFVALTFYLIVVKQTGGAMTNDIGNVTVRALCTALIYGLMYAGPGQYVHINMVSPIVNNLLEMALGHTSRDTLSRYNRRDHAAVLAARPELARSSNVVPMSLIEMVAVAGMGLLASWVAIIFADWNNTLLPETYGSSTPLPVARRLTPTQEWSSVDPKSILIIAIATMLVSIVPIYSFFETHTQWFTAQFLARHSNAEKPYPAPALGLGMTTYRRGHFGALGLFGSGNDYDPMKKGVAAAIAYFLAIFVLHTSAYTNLDVGYHFARWIHDPDSVSDTWPIIVAVVSVQCVIYFIVAYFAVANLAEIQGLREQINSEILEASADEKRAAEFIRRNLGAGAN